MTLNITFLLKIAILNFLAAEAFVFHKHIF